METPPSRLRAKPSWLLHQTATHSHRLVTDALAIASSRGYHYAILSALDECGPGSQAALGRRTGIDRSDVVAVVNELAALGHLDRSPDPADRRRNVITLTEDGSRHLNRLDDLVNQAQHAFLAPLTTAEEQQLTSLLARLVEHHGLP